MAKANPFQFISQVRSEVSKVTWPGRPGSVLSRVGVVGMAARTANFLSLVDFEIRQGLSLLLTFF